MLTLHTDGHPTEVGGGPPTRGSHRLLLRRLLKHHFPVSAGFWETGLCRGLLHLLGTIQQLSSAENNSAVCQSKVLRLTDRRRRHPQLTLPDHEDKADIKWLTVKISNEIKSNKLFLGGISLLWLPVLIYGGIPDAVHLNYQRAMGMVSGINRQHW